MTYQTLIVETDQAVTLIRLNRPEALNALNGQLMDEMTAAQRERFYHRNYEEMMGAGS